MTFKRTSAFAAALAATALTVSACGGGTTTDTKTTSSTTSTASGAASSTTSESPSSSSTTEDTGSSSGLGDAKVGDSVDAVELGNAMAEVFKDGNSGHMTMDMGGGIKAEGDFVIKGGKQNTQMTMEMAGQKMEMISIGETTYMKGLVGDKWVKTDGTTGGADGTPQLNTFDPKTMAKAFEGIKAKVTDKSGDTTTYSLELSLKKMFDAMGTDMPTGVTLPDSIPVTYTLDGENRPVKSTINMGMNIVIEYSDWGKKVNISAPPAAQVTTMG